MNLYPFWGNLNPIIYEIKGIIQIKSSRYNRSRDSPEIETCYQ